MPISNQAIIKEFRMLINQIQRARSQGKTEEEIKPLLERKEYLLTYAQNKSERDRIRKPKRKRRQSNPEK